MDVAAVVRRITDRLGDRAVFIGGVAVEAYAPYRRTHDIDVVVRERDFPALKTCLVEAGFAHRRTHLAKHAFKAREAGEVDAYTERVGEVDAYTERVGEVPVEEPLFRRARSLPYAGISLSIASLEDLLRFKLSAGREMDLADVALLLHARRDELDMALLKTLVGLDDLRERAPLVPDLLPEEYGWQARQRLKAWLREAGWTRSSRGKAARR